MVGEKCKPFTLNRPWLGKIEFCDFLDGCKWPGHVTVSVSLFHLSWLTSLSRNAPNPVASLNQIIVRGRRERGLCPQASLRIHKAKARQIEKGKWGMEARDGEVRLPSCTSHCASPPFPDGGGRTALAED